MGSRTTHIAIEDAGPLVSDVMLIGPDTFPVTATVAEARTVFESPRHKLLVVVDGSRYVGSIRPESVEGADDDAPLGSLQMADVPTLAPGEPSTRATELDASRTPVVDADGDLVGLVCLNRTKASYCVMSND
jgi:CBS domain-containing protein